MGSLDTPPSWADPIVIASIERAFDATWPVIRAHKAGANKARMNELSMALSQSLSNWLPRHNRSPGASEVGFGGLRRFQPSEPVSCLPVDFALDAFLIFR